MPRDVRAGRLSPEQIEANFCDLHPRLTEHQAVVESARCLFCHDAPCIEACPTGIDIPAFIRKIQTGNPRGAAMDILEANIMGATCANVCPVEVLCEGSCVRNTGQDRSVEIGRLQRYATDHLMDSGIQPFTRAADTGFRVAVVGAGPAGLACAHGLSRHGHQVTVFEAREKPGGLNEYGIAAYKMLDDRAGREVEMILGVGGIELRTGVRVGEDVTLDQLRGEFDAVFLGIGLGDVNRLGLHDEDIPGMHDAVDYIARLRQADPSTLEVGRRVVVIGGGSTAIDIAIQIRKLGADQVTMVYRGPLDRMSATEVERQLARDAGVVIRTHAKPVRILCNAEGLTGVELERTDTGERYTVEADQCFKAIGQRLSADDIDVPMAGGRLARETNGGNRGFVLAGGDCVAGLDLTVAAVQDGKLAAQRIHERLTTDPNHG